MPPSLGSITGDLMVFLSARPEELARFFAETGAEPQSIRNQLEDQSFQSGAIDYLVSNEPLLLAFCEEAGHDPARLSALARQEGRWM